MVHAITFLEAVARWYSDMGCRQSLHWDLFYFLPFFALGQSRHEEEKADNGGQTVYRGTWSGTS